MFGNTVLMCWFGSTLRASWRTRHPADVSPSFRDYALCPKWDSSANGGLSCMVRVRRLPDGCVQCERATARFTRPTGACSAKRARSKWSVGREHSNLLSYVIVFTTRSSGWTADILRSYCMRWQIELAFKRLKSLARLGHVPKHHDRSSRAWLYGKLLVTLLAEKLIRIGRDISPSGYTLSAQRTIQSVA